MTKLSDGMPNAGSASFPAAKSWYVPPSVAVAFRWREIGYPTFRFAAKARSYTVVASSFSPSTQRVSSPLTKFAKTSAPRSRFVPKRLGSL